MSKNDDLESKALQLLASKSAEGILQCNLWRDLKTSSREGSRLLLRLENKSLIQRERELFHGRWTYRVRIKRKTVEVDSLLDVPCIRCLEFEKCGGNSNVSPATCRELSKWLQVTG
ncbi:MAG: Lrp/AsnC family transcriptional regulator [Candidatus Bathyarchaeia archaeon]